MAGVVTQAVLSFSRLSRVLFFCSTPFVPLLRNGNVVSDLRLYLVIAEDNKKDSDVYRGCTSRREL